MEDDVIKRLALEFDATMEAASLGKEPPQATQADQRVALFFATIVYEARRAFVEWRLLQEQEGSGLGPESFIPSQPDSSDNVTPLRRDENGSK